MFQNKCAKIAKDFEMEKAMNVQAVAIEDYTFFRERESSAESSLKVR